MLLWEQRLASGFTGHASKQKAFYNDAYRRSEALFYLVSQTIQFFMAVLLCKT